MTEVNYKELLDEIICNSSKDELMPLVRCENLPFEYCEKILAKKGIGWRTKVLIARRKDCPKAVLTKLIKRNGERFLRTYLYGDFYSIPVFVDGFPIEIGDDIVDLILHKSFGLDMLCSHCNLQDSVLRKMTDIIISQSKNKLTRCFSDFLYYQYRLPSDCIVKMAEFARSINYDKAPFSEDHVMQNLLLMVELPEDEFIRYIEAHCEHGSMYDRRYEITKKQLLKIAANPAITKYVEMVLKMKFADDVDVMRVLNKYENNRIEYRKSNKQ